ncbi:hypothetical protein CR532_01625 [Candidatus Borreliella tachyglossi]|uniref:Tetratricopeptide repeat family protein n=1 Tax=Candidatus Borreliella tachyglossi TaxID=1964448 RepID=A0A2S1LWP0_9SPIR|nr:hypothetical protein [Candidatus Borreliella tachyglossi]AWG42701.1 hypothetical protein CR532_01625 [Candidatus Borreliella tachyglossi]
MRQYTLILVLINIMIPIYATIPIEDKDRYEMDELYKESMLLKELKEYDKSKSLLIKIINKDAKQVDAYLLLSELGYLMGNWLEAIEQIKTYLGIIDFKDAKNYLDISWAYFLIGETSNSMDYIIKFIRENQNLLNTNIYILMDTILKKGFYHFIEDEDSMFNLIINTIFQIETNDDIIFTIFLNNLDIIKQLPFYQFNRIKIKDLDLQIRSLRTLKNSIHGIAKTSYFS